MKLFILAAGTGKRLRPLTEAIPKSLVKIDNETTLVERQIFIAKNSELFNEIVIITGYKENQITERLKGIRGIKIAIFYNPFYDISGPLVSLWTAHFKMKEDDFMITNGDNIYKSYVFKKILPQDSEIIQLTIDYKIRYEKDDMKVKLDKLKNVVKVHKKLSPAETDAESVGLVVIKGLKSREIFVSKILELVRKKEYLAPDRYWHEIFNSLIADGVVIKTREIDEKDWLEIDTYKDLKKIKNFLKEED